MKHLFLRSPKEDCSPFCPHSLGSHILRLNPLMPKLTVHLTSLSLPDEFYAFVLLGRNQCCWRWLAATVPRAPSLSHKLSLQEAELSLWHNSSMYASLLNQQMFFSPLLVLFLTVQWKPSQRVKLDRWDGSHLSDTCIILWGFFPSSTKQIRCSP